MDRDKYGFYLIYYTVEYITVFGLKKLTVINYGTRFEVS